MTDLTVVVPSRGRPRAVAHLAGAFRATCTADTALVFAVDESDPARPAYTDAARAQEDAPGIGSGGTAPTVEAYPTETMVAALNAAATAHAGRADPPEALVFMGDDHEPHTHGWDRMFRDALYLRPGIVYGDDTVHRGDLPTQWAISTTLVRARGYMVPPGLWHMYADDYMLWLGQCARCITYMPDVLIPHHHPIAGRVPWDEGYRRVNAPEVYAHDRAALAEHLAAHGEADVRAVTDALAAAGATR